MVSGKLLYFYKNGVIKIYNEFFKDDFYLNKIKRQLEKNNYKCYVENIIYK